MMEKVCDCGHEAKEHNEFGCLFQDEEIICNCFNPKSEVEKSETKEFLRRKIASLETDLIHARRVADELQAVIDKVNQELEEERRGRIFYDLAPKKSNDDE